MKSNLLFNIGLGIDLIILLIAASNIPMTFNNPIGNEGLSGIGRVAMIVIPLLLLLLIGAAFWLKSSGKILFANILLWLPALPMLAAIVLWGGLAILFILFGK